MIAWSSIAYGAALSAVFTAVVVALVTRRPLLTVMLAVAAAVGPIGWNAVLRATHAREFFTDAPIAVFPISWQDTGSGVITLAVATAILGLGPLARDAARRTVALATLTGLVACLVDVYLY